MEKDEGENLHLSVTFQKMYIAMLKQFLAFAEIELQAKPEIILIYFVIKPNKSYIIPKFQNCPSSKIF